MNNATKEYDTNMIVRVKSDFLKEIDEFAKEYSPPPSRSDVVRLAVMWYIQIKRHRRKAAGQQDRNENPKEGDIVSINGERLVVLGVTTAGHPKRHAVRKMGLHRFIEDRE